MNRAPVTALFSLLLLMSFGLTQNVSADEAGSFFLQCASLVDQVSLDPFDDHGVFINPLSETSVLVIASGGGLGPGSPGFPADPPDKAIFLLDGSTTFGFAESNGPVFFQATYTGLSPGVHSVEVCYIEVTASGDPFSPTITDTLTHTDVLTFTTGPVDLCETVDCSPLDDQCNVGVCNPSNGLCEAQTTNEGASCDDGNACNVGETCQAGLCTGGAPPDCSALGDQCNAASCNSFFGREGNCDTRTPVADDTPCNDGELCNVGETCQAGLCTGGAPPDCSALGDQCNAAMCDSVTGCFSEPVLDGTQCDDDDPNTQNDICEAGVCSGDTPGGFSCGLGTTLNVITNECEPDVTQADLDSVEAQRDAILTTLFEFLRVFGVI